MLGITSSVTLLESLEKRVKSRFSQVLILDPVINSQEEFVVAAKDRLSLEYIPELDVDEVWVNTYNASVVTFLQAEPVKNFLIDQYELSKSFDKFSIIMVMRHLVF